MNKTNEAVSPLIKGQSNPLEKLSLASIAQSEKSTATDIVTLSEAKVWDSNEIANAHGFTVHPAAKLFAMLDENEIKSLAEDITRNGQRVPIATQNKVIVDGRNRLVACAIARITPQFKEIEGEAVEAVISLNLQRRNLDESQKATLALRLIPKLREEAEARKKLGKTNDSGRAGGKASKLAGEMVGVSPRIVERLERIEKYAPEQIVEIENGARTVGEVDRLLSDKIKLVKKHDTEMWGRIARGEAKFDEVYAKVLEKHPTNGHESKPGRRGVLVIVSDDLDAIRELATTLPNYPLLENKFEGFSLLPSENINEEEAKPFFAAVDAYRSSKKR